jgi:hypothetical protein
MIFPRCLVVGPKTILLAQEPEPDLAEFLRAHGVEWKIAKI